MIRILFKSEQGVFDTNLQIGDLDSALKNPESILWLDIAKESITQVEPILNDVFNFHPLAIDDALNEEHAPKVNDWQEYLHIVLREASYTSSESEQLRAPELNIFLGANYIVTYSQEISVNLDRVWNTCQQDQCWIKRGTTHILYWIADELVSEAVSAVEDMQDELEQVEDQLFAEAGPDTLEKIFTLKRNVLHLRRIVIPQKEVLNKLARNEYQVINKVDRIFFRDVYDHLLQLGSLLDDMVVLVSSARVTYLSVVNNQMNDVVKTLTVITAFFMPLAFISGFFGMNFFQATMPFEPWTGTLAFVTTLAAMVLIPLLMFLWMRHKSWI
jgi:magnesium transporter